MKWSEIETLFKTTSGIHGEIEIEEFSLDSRIIRNPENTVFLAHRGIQHDGHDFIPELIDRGVRFFIVEKEIKSGKDIFIIKVDNAISALQKIAGYHRSRFNIPIVAITGSNGKTTSKEWLSQVLSLEQKVIKSPKSYNSQIGVPLSLLKISDEHEIGVFEAGISTTGEMHNLQSIIQPTLGIFTTIGPAHDEGFESRNQKIEEKSVLFANCEKIICRKDNQEVYSFIKNKYPESCFAWSSTDEDSDIFFRPKESNRYTVDYNAKQLEFQLPFDFPIWVENALHVITASLVLGIDEKNIQSAVDQFNPVKMRLQLKPGINDCYIIDDTYNNDLQGLEVALNFLKLQKQHSRKTVIISDLIQTGLPQEEVYRTVNQLLTSENIDRIIGIGTSISENKHLFDLNSKFYQNTEDFIKNPPSFRNEMILVKGARKFQLEKIVTLLERNTHRTVLEINFESIIYNLKQYKKLLDPKTKIMVMVKAFAYGGGSLEIANLLQFHKVDYLGVAYLQEGISLRKNGIHLPIMVMNPDFSELDLFQDFNLEPEVFDMNGLLNVADFGESLNVQLKLETGMNRLGFTVDQIPEVIEILTANPQIKIQGIFSHLASADSHKDDEYSFRQIKNFEEMYSQITNKIGYSPARHILNSSGIARFGDKQYEMVRLGIGLYGFDPTKSNLFKLRPVSALKTRVSQIKKVKEGDTVGYGRVGKVERNSELAILPIGYADGYLRVFSNGNGKVEINNAQYPTIGNVCMDMTMVDVTGSGVKVGDEVTVFGSSPSIESLAHWANTIPYEILTNVSQRVKRIYISE